MRSRTVALKGFGASALPMLLTTISVPRTFMPVAQLASNPREMPTNATTAAMPIEMPTSVNPVRTGRRWRPRTTMVKKVMLGCWNGGWFIGHD